MDKKKPLVAIIMGSNSDWPTMKHTADVFADFGVPYEAEVQVIIAGAGGAAHLPGMVASKTTLPVLGVPVRTKHLDGQDSLLSIVQMPKGVPVATFAIGDAGAANAGLFAVSLLANHDAELAQKLVEFREKQIEKVKAMELNEKP